ncbi:rho GTPase-activating protein 18 isoform X2 [Hemibagrus wyckioides]|uniref:rho GTPase-activating protein 18 isoform X2 n=1 Tax=Hemibagrus wyckioides TaxID=337641 RepID=UPI00266CF26C|nr:rho GTPase-activating protein 18 isoform X2 [Hemibagrus wyckioides]
MNRNQDARGVVLTGYISNNEAFSPACAAATSSGDEPEAPGPRYYLILASCSYCDHQQHCDAAKLQIAAEDYGIWMLQRIMGRKPAPYNAQRTRAGTRPPYQRCNSQDSLDELAMDDYWKEMEIIQHSGDAEPQDEVQLKVADEGEQEEAWLTEAGLATLFDESATDDDDGKVLLSTLTRTQAAAVHKRLETLRKRNKPHSVPDVRDIFKPQDTKDDESKSREGSENTKKEEETSSGNGEGKADTETDINQEVSFSEQALTYKEGSKVTPPIDETDDRLPDFRVVRDKTGMTKVGDLSLADMKKVHRLVLIEVSALFDTAGIDLKTHKPLRIKVKESGLFGVPLTTLLEQDQKMIPGTRVPIILQRLISHIEDEGLDTEGILRVPGAATRVKAVCQELELKFYDGLFPWESLKQHDSASVLKLFIRELPHPLLTVEYFSAFFSVLKFPTKKQQLQALNLLVLLLPASSRDTLKALLEFLQRVIDHKERNKMTLNNVAMVMAPNIFMFKGFRSKITEQQEFTMATGMANIVRLLIRYQDLLWTIPKFVMTQVRKQNTERKVSRERAVKKLLKKMAYDRDRERNSEKVEKNTEVRLDTSVSDLWKECPVRCRAVAGLQGSSTSVDGGFIRVQAPQFSKVSMAVELTEELRASDILTRFLSQESSLLVKREDLYLYEIGGNIKERCLDEETYMKALLELNPTAEWVIKSVQR